MTKQSHTPTPWETNHTGNIWGDVYNPEHDGDLPLLFKPHGNQEANAAFIVEACNSYYENKRKAGVHDELVAALEKTSNKDADQWYTFDEVMEIAKEALRKARGEV